MPTAVLSFLRFIHSEISRGCRLPWQKQIKVKNIAVDRNCYKLTKKSISLIFADEVNLILKCAVTRKWSGFTLVEKAIDQPIEGKYN
jgi:hypothetical protein